MALSQFFSANEPARYLNSIRYPYVSWLISVIGFPEDRGNGSPPKKWGGGESKLIRWNVLGSFEGCPLKMPLLRLVITDDLLFSDLFFQSHGVGPCFSFWEKKLRRNNPSEIFQKKISSDHFLFCVCYHYFAVGRNPAPAWNVHSPETSGINYFSWHFSVRFQISSTVSFWLHPSNLCWTRFDWWQRKNMWKKKTPLKNPLHIIFWRKKYLS